MNAKAWRFDPLDTWFFREARPFGAATGGELSSVFPPPAHTVAADLELLNGQVTESFDRLIELVRRTDGADREAAKEHLLELLELVGNDDPAVLAARRALASALF